MKRVILSMVALGALAGVGMGAVPAEARGGSRGHDANVNVVRGGVTPNSYFTDCGYFTDWRCVVTTNPVTGGPEYNYIQPAPVAP